MEKLTAAFFEQDPLVCARELIGCTFRWKSTAGIIVETESYAEHGDEACHTFLRRSVREFVVKKPAGTAYVYLNYGDHWMANVVCKGAVTGDCGFVLIRALEPTHGISAMQKRRGRDKLTDLCSGPGKLTKALGIDGTDHGKNLTLPASRNLSGFWTSECDEFEIETDVRIGISKAKEFEWRFLMAGSEHVSVKASK
ncbi:UNVERIFIED_CONTAM: hypothetical protein GTU68_017160 [Idotea baltica]|nr:hypothetical protein [Idotea baltica]